MKPGPSEPGSSHPLESAAVESARIPLIAHIVYRFDIGGLENGVVNLINSMPEGRYRHAVISLTTCTDFRFRIRRNDVAFFALNKREGKDIGIYYKLWRLLRSLEPAIVHTRNLPTLDAQLPAALAGVRCRIHGEHGRDMIDLDGTSWKYNLLRRAVRPLIHWYIPLSRDLEQWLRVIVGVPESRVTRIYNGVDTQTFSPVESARTALPVAGFAPSGTVVIGTVGRMQEVKDQLTLVHAFLRMIDAIPNGRERLRLVMIGDGPLRKKAAELLEQAGASDLAWLPGARNDVAQLLRALDVFVLPSLAEGISNTILEAMASGLPVVATRVGGNAELVKEGETGMLAPPGEPAALAEVLRQYVDDADLRRRHGGAARARTERKFSLDAMVHRYMAVYDELSRRKAGRGPG